MLVWLQFDIPQIYIDALLEYSFMTMSFGVVDSIKEDTDFGYVSELTTENKLLPGFSDIGFDNLSVVLNFLPLLLSLLIMWTIHLFLGIIVRNLNKKYQIDSTPVGFAMRSQTKRRNFNKLGWWSKFLINFYLKLTYGAYVQMVFELMMFAGLNSVLEIISTLSNIKASRKAGVWIISSMCSLAILLMFLSFIVFQIYHFYKNKSSLKKIREFYNRGHGGIHFSGEVHAIFEKLQRHKKSKGLYEGLKQPIQDRNWQIIWQSFHLVFSVRRLLFITIVVCFIPCNSQIWSWVQVGFFLVVQLIYLWFIIWIRSFIHWENNTIEIINELIFTFLIIWTASLPYNKNEGVNLLWSYDLKAQIMAYTVIYGSLAICSFSFITIVIKLIIKLANKYWKSKTYPKPANVDSSDR